MGEKLREINEGMKEAVKPLPIPPFEIKLAQIEQSRATDEGMPEPKSEIVMQPGEIKRLR